MSRSFKPQKKGQYLPEGPISGSEEKQQTRYVVSVETAGAAPVRTVISDSDPGRGVISSISLCDSDGAGANPVDRFLYRQEQGAAIFYRWARPGEVPILCGR